MSAEAAPVPAEDRIVLIDIVRGMALFGILAANMRAFTAPLGLYSQIQALFPARADVLAQGVTDTFFQGKFVTIFSFLFGLGFAIQMTRAEARGAKFLGFYPRRLAVLGLFGLIHGLFIWAGDILLTYAIGGALLLGFRGCSNKTLLRWAIGLICLPLLAGTILALLWFGWHPAWLKPDVPDMAKMHAIIAIYATGHITAIEAENLREWVKAAPALGFSLYAMALFMLGLVTWRAGIVQNIHRFVPVLKRVALYGLLSGVPLSAFTAWIHSRPPRNDVLEFIGNVLWLPSAHILAAAYVSLIALAFLNTGLRPVLKPFAAVGRMALTDYLMQSVLCLFLFSRYGTGLYGKIGPYGDFVPTIAIYSAQLVFSNLWLAWFRYGPMEWLWRGLTYGYFPRLRRGQDLPAAAIEA